MLSFTVHEAPNPPASRAERAESLAFVRDGFSWTAALFTPIWMLVHRMWWPLLGYIAAAGAIELLRASGLAHPGWASVAALALGLLVGFEAATLRRWQLERSGWKTLGSVSGRSREECERRFFDMWLPTQPAVLPQETGASAAPGRRSLADAISGAGG